MSLRQRLSVVMITRNEAALLEDCLASVSWADEIIVLDSGSSDKTLDIARQMGARVEQNHHWQGFGKQRQRAQRYATGEMILMLDADERVTAELRGEIEQILVTAPSDHIYSIARRNWFLGRFMRFSGWYPDRVTRLYPAKFRFNDDQVHESLKADGVPVKALQGDLIHLTCLDFIQFQHKQLNYAHAWAEQRYSQGRTCHLFSAYVHALAAFCKVLLLRAGLLDGKRGWLLAVVSAQYTFNKYAALWSKNQPAESDYE